MSQDDDFPRTDRTILRPRPGGDRQKAAPKFAPETPQRRRESRPTADDLRIDELCADSRNTLLRHAGPLLVLAGRLRFARDMPNAAGLRSQLADEIRRFTARLDAEDIPSALSVPASYALCVLLDTAVMSTPWGIQSQWASNPLLRQFHGDVHGGEKFFEILDRVRPHPENYIDLLEFLYVCLSMGFSGKYGVEADGRESVEMLRSELYREIRSFRERPTSELSKAWEGVKDRRSGVLRFAPVWIVAAAAAAILSLAFVFFNSQLNRLSSPTLEGFAGVGFDRAPVVTYSARESTVTLTSLLAGPISRGAVTVEEDGGLTTVILSGVGLFPSGGVEVDDAFEAVLAEIAAALEQLPGRVTVVGHTDDVPVRSFRYANNFDLSRQRAIAVADVMRKYLTHPGRLTALGAGPTQPRYEPASAPENRARNRRVEIVYQAGAGST